jgi:hypothetical protein
MFETYHATTLRRPQKTEDKQLSHSLAALLQPLPQVDDGKEDLGAIKRRGGCPLEGSSTSVQLEL